MARARRRLGPALAAAASLALAVHAPAQALRALHVDALSMRADRSHLRVGEVFHLAIHVRVRERVAALDELVIPDVGTMQMGGDERSVTTSQSGTDVVETLTLEPTQSGTFTFNGAYIDAIDARTRKPSRFSANPVRVVVDRPDSVLADTTASLTRFVLMIVLAAIVALAAGAAVVVFALVRHRRKIAAVPVAAPAAPAAASPPPRTPRDEVADALRAYRTSPANGSLMRLRGALFVAAGANPGSTLRDALSVTSDHALRAALAAAEHTAFGPAHARDESSGDLIVATEAWLR